MCVCVWTWVRYNTCAMSMNSVPNSQPNVRQHCCTAIQCFLNWQVFLHIVGLHVVTNPAWLLACVHGCLLVCLRGCLSGARALGPVPPTQHFVTESHGTRLTIADTRIKLKMMCPPRVLTTNAPSMRATYVPVAKCNALRAVDPRIWNRLLCGFRGNTKHEIRSKIG